MYIEKREYHLRSQHIAPFLEMVEKRELPLFGEAGDHVIGYFYSEIGDLNLVTVLWRWETLEQRDSVRRDLIGRFFQTGLEQELESHVVRQTNAIWKVAPFFDAQNMRLFAASHVGRPEPSRQQE